MYTTLSLAQSSSFEDEVYKNYSEFKHGSKNIARLFGRQLANHLKPELEKYKDRNLVIYSAPYGNIPTASNALKDYFLSASSMTFLDNNISIGQSKINRLYSYDEDYGKMSKEDREKLISNDKFLFDKSNIQDNDVLVFIDDIKITGQHEVKIKEMLEREGIKNEIILIYLFEYTGDNPAIEHDLNHHSVNNLKDVNRIIRNDEFIFNTRVVKYILKADVEEFVSFITYQSEIFRETLFNYTILNQYHNNKKYKSNFQILKNIVENE